MLSDLLSPPLKDILKSALEFMPDDNGVPPPHVPGKAAALARRVHALQPPELLEFRSAMQVGEMEFAALTQQAVLKTNHIQDEDAREAAMLSYFPEELACEMSGTLLILTIAGVTKPIQEHLDEILKLMSPIPPSPRKDITQ